MVSATQREPFLPHQSMALAVKGDLIDLSNADDGHENSHSEAEQPKLDTVCEAPAAENGELYDQSQEPPLTSQSKLVHMSTLWRLPVNCTTGSRPNPFNSSRNKSMSTSIDSAGPRVWQSYT